MRPAHAGDAPAAVAGSGPRRNHDHHSCTTFDPVAFKTTTRAQWQSAAEPWHRWGPFIGSWLGAATDRMIEQADIGEGSRVLDVAAGAGEQSLTIARRVGPNGHVLATDIAPPCWSGPQRTPRTRGSTSVGTREIDGEDLEQLDAGSFDAVVSRVGLIYFPDQARALAGIQHALRDGGRASFVVYSTPDRNEFFSIPVRIIRGRAQLPPPLPGQPGPFSLGRAGRARGDAHGCRLPRRPRRRRGLTRACCPRRRSVSASSGSRSVRCTR